MTLVQLLGRLHPLVLHFPIAFILFAAALEIVRMRWDRPVFALLVPLLLGVASLATLAACITGWIFAHEYYPAPSLHWMMEWHRWLGIATTVLAGLATWTSWYFADTPVTGARWMRRASIWLTADMLAASAHLGALMVWGNDYFDGSALRTHGLRKEKPYFGVSWDAGLRPGVQASSRDIREEGR